MLAYYDSMYGPVPVKVIGVQRQGPSWLISIVVTANFPKPRKDQAKSTRPIFKRGKTLTINSIWIFPRPNVIMTENGNIAATIKYDPATVFAGFSEKRSKTAMGSTKRAKSIASTNETEAPKVKTPKPHVEKTDLQVIMGARALINKPEKWTKGANAVDADGTSINGMDDNVVPVKMCAYGALERYMWLNRDKSGKTYSFHIRDKVQKLIETYFQPADSVEGIFWRLTGFNDNATHKQVMDLFSVAAKKAKMSEANASASSQASATV